MAKTNAATNPVKVYVIKQVNPSDQFDDLFNEFIRDYRNFDDNYPNMVINPDLNHTNVHGPVYNNDYGTIACELYRHVTMNLELAMLDWYKLRQELETEYPLQRKEPMNGELLDILLEYDFRPPQTSHLRLAPHTLTDKQTWTQEEMLLWRNIFDGMNCADDDVVVMVALELLSGHKWNSKELYGSGQSEWVSVLYDETMYTPEDLDRLRCSFFNLGTEWVFCNDYQELFTDPDHPGRDVQPEDIDGYTAYFPKECPTTDEVKAWAADIISEEGCTPETVKLLQYAGERRVPYYTEA